jgi:hypothetical protein
MSRESLRARFAALGVTPLFVGTNGEVFDARRTAVAQALPDLFDNDRDGPLAELIAEALNRAIAADEAKE